MGLREGFLIFVLFCFVLSNQIIEDVLNAPVETTEYSKERGIF